MSKTTDLLEQRADLLFDNISGWEQRTLERIGRRIKKMGEMPLYDVKSINLMAETKGEMEAIIKDLAKITGQNVQDVQNMYAEAIESQHLENSPIYDYRNKTFVPFSENKDLQSLVKAYSKSTNETMINLSKTKALGFIDKAGNFKNMQDSIYDVFGKATMTVATGTSDFHTAMRDAIEQLGGSGIRVHYGSGVNRRLDTVVRQNVLWGAKQASVAYTEMIGEELDCDGIEIDYHSNPRPSHEFMQGKQYSLIGKKTINGVTYESADEALERLEDYGCLHYKTPIILGISEPRYSDKELAELKRQDQEQKEVTFEKQVNGETVKTTMSKTGYEWTQAMRQLETEARKEKEIINTLKASGDNIGAKQHKQRLKTINKKYNEIAEQTGIPARLDRMSIVKGGSAPQKPLTNSGSGGIMKTKWDNDLQPRGQVTEKIKEEDLYSWVAKELKVSETEATEYVDSVMAFTDAGSDIYSEIRRYQRNEPLQFLSEADTKKMSDDIEMYIQKAPRWNGGPTFRGSTVSDDELATYQQGYQIQMGGTSSWSGTQQIAKEFAERNSSFERPNPVIYHCDTQNKGTGIRHISIYELEDEVLCSKESVYEVVRTELDTEYITHVYLKEV